MPPASLEAGLLRSGERTGVMLLQIAEGGREGAFPCFLLFAHGRWLKMHSGPSSILSCTLSLDPVVRAEKKHLIASNKN